jgi:hypothetical protein
MEWLNVCISAALFVQGGPPAAPPPAPKAPTPPAAAAPAAPAPAAVATPVPVATTTTGQLVVVSEGQWRAAGSCNSCPTTCCETKRFGSDRDFDGFIGPISAPIYAKDPRSLTELRGLYVHNWNSDGFLGGGDFDFYGLQARLAVSEKLQLFVDKAGYLDLNAGNGAVGNRSGWLNTAFGFKYTFLRDVECQRLAAFGVMYEAPTGEDEVFQSRGDGYITPFLTWGREFGDCWHFIGNVAHSTALDSSANSSFLFTQLHLDKGINGWLYPLVEANYYYYTQSGDTTLAAGERDGLLSFGNEGTAGSHRLSIAGGLKAKLGRNIETGVAYERSVIGGDSLLDDRVIGEIIFRY